MILDVKGFSVNNLSVKVNENNNLVIEGVKEIKTESMFSRKSFKHQFNISKCDLNQVSSALSSDGVLTIVAPKKVTILFRIYLKVCLWIIIDRAKSLNNY